MCHRIVSRRAIVAITVCWGRCCRLLGLLLLFWAAAIVWGCLHCCLGLLSVLLLSSGVTAIVCWGQVCWSPSEAAAAIWWGQVCWLLSRWGGMSAACSASVVTAYDRWPLLCVGARRASVTAVVYWGGAPHHLAPLPSAGTAVVWRCCCLLVPLSRTVVCWHCRLGLSSPGTSV